MVHLDGQLTAVSRTVTAPFDRLKVYLITTTHTHYNAEAIAASNHSQPVKMGWRAIGNLWGAVRCIYADGGGTRAFWVGNGLNVTKIFPVSPTSFSSLHPETRFCCVARVAL